MTHLLRSAVVALTLVPLTACFDFLDPEPADLAEGLWALETTGSHLFGDCGAMGSVGGEPGTMEVFVAVDHDEVTLSFGPEPLEGTLRGSLLSAEAVYAFDSRSAPEEGDAPVEAHGEVDCVEDDDAAVDCAEIGDGGRGHSPASEDEVVYRLSGEVEARDSFSGTLRIDMDFAAGVCSLTTGFQATLVSETRSDDESNPRMAVHEPAEG